MSTQVDPPIPVDEDVKALAVQVYMSLIGCRPVTADMALRDAAEKLQEAKLCFRNVGRSNQTEMTFGMCGAQNVLGAALRLVGTTDVPTAFPDLAAEISDLIFNASLNVANEVARRIAPEKIYLGFSSVTALLTKKGDRFFRDHVNQAGVLVAILSAEIHTRGLNERGNPMLRDMAIFRATRTEFDPTTMHLQ